VRLYERPGSGELTFLPVDEEPELGEPYCAVGIPGEGNLIPTDLLVRAREDAEAFLGFMNAKA
jgi:hypothetical protein